MNKNKLTGLFFGSFNPIHIGHLALANYMLEFTEIDELWFVVSPQNPLKQKASLAPDYHRLEMVKLALEENYKMRVCDIEFKMPKPSYTIDTLTYLSEKYPSKKFSIIMGADNLKSFNKWKNFEIILNSYKIFIYPRLGYNSNNNEYKGNIKFTEAPIIEISSTFIRDAIKNGKNIRYFLNEKVFDYVNDCRLYK